MRKSKCCFKALWVAVFAALLAVETQASPLALERENDFYQDLARHTGAFIDDTLEQTIDEVINTSDQFTPITTKYIDLGTTKGRVWLRTSVQNPGDRPGTWRLDINRQYYQELNVFLVPADQPAEQILRSHISDSFNDRVIRDRMLGVDFSLEAFETVEIYVSFTSDTTTFIPLGVGTIDATTDLHAREHTLNWMLNGALIALMAITLMMTSIIGWRLSTSFCLYVMAGFVYIFHADGYTFVHFWPDHMHLNDSFNLRFMVLMPLFGLLFSRALFRFDKHAPRFDRYVVTYIFIASSVALFAYQIYQVQFLKVLAYIVVPVGSFGQLVAGIIALRANLQGAKPYFVGALIIMSAFLYAVMAHLLSGYFSMDATLDFGHFSLITEGLAFAAAISVRLIGLRDQRDRALESELAIAKEKLELSSELQRTQEDFIHARKMADMRRTQLSSVSHDLQQPLASLRNALNRMDASDEEATLQMHKAFDYLEKLAREQIIAGKSDNIGSSKEFGLESFPIAAVLDNIKEMFADEARTKGLDFRYRPSIACVKTDPIALMRAVSNLVSNAIKHSASGGVLLAARLRGDHVRVEIWDTGEGMSEEQLKRCLEPYEKGKDSEGSGLGLSIVNTISIELGLNFEMRFRKGRGTVAFLHLPIGR